MVRVEVRPTHVCQPPHTQAHSSPTDDLLRLIQYIPPNATHPTLLHAELILPPLTTVRIGMDVLKAFLKYTDHMPDAQRGWDVPGAILTLLPVTDRASSSDTERERGRVYTRTVLVNLATPDFSMPYNVIIMTCTLVALVFGTIFNLLVRRFVVVDMREGADVRAEGEIAQGEKEE